jgi:hypothetical protein
MGLAAEIAEAHGVPVCRDGSMEFIALANALSFIQALRSRGIIIYGIEGFHLRGGYVIPDMDAIGDFSGSLTADETALYAMDFVDSVRGNPGPLFLLFNLKMTQGGS